MRVLRSTVGLVALALVACSSAAPSRVDTSRGEAPVVRAAGETPRQITLAADAPTSALWTALGGEPPCALLVSTAAAPGERVMLAAPPREVEVLAVRADERGECPPAPDDLVRAAREQHLFFRLRDGWVECDGCEGRYPPMASFAGAEHERCVATVIATEEWASPLTFGGVIDLALAARERFATTSIIVGHRSSVSPPCSPAGCL
jgi:hypothetical protein